MPLISVVMPIRDGSAFADQAILSIRGQTCDDFELIIVDDGSQEETRLLLERHAREDPRIRLVRQEPGGVTRALNRGLAMARGEFVARMDGDDKSYPDRLALQVAGLKRSDAVALGAAVTLIDADGKRIGQLSYPGEIASVDAGVRVDAILCHPAVMARADIVRRAGGYRPFYEGAEDYDLWLRMLRFGRILNLDTPLLEYRVHQGQVSTRHEARGRVAAFLARYVAFRVAASGGTEPALTTGIAASALVAVDSCLKDPSTQTMFPVPALRKITRRAAIIDPRLRAQVTRLSILLARRAVREGDPITTVRCLTDIVRPLVDGRRAVTN